MASLKGGEIDEKTIQKFPTTDKMKTQKGKKEGDITVFREGMVPKAYMWKDDKWEYVGEVMAQGGGAGQAGKRHYEGDRFFPAGEYDYIFDVDINEGAPKAKLPYNEGDNTLVVAERFLTREGLGLGFKEQITDFIRKNTKGGGYPIPGASQPQTQPAKKASPAQDVFPMRQTVFYEQMNIDGLLAKIVEFQTKLSEAKNPAALTEHEVKYVTSIAVKLRDPALYAYVKEFGSFEIEIAKKLLKWPAENAVPILDLWRCIVLHHCSQVFFSGVDSGMPIIAALVGKLKNGPPVLWSIFYKFLSNLFMHTSNSIALVRAKDIIHEGYKALNKSDAKVVALVANYLMNCSSNADMIPSVNDAFIKEQIGYCNDLLLTSAADSEAILKLAIALGNFAVLHPNGSSEASIGIRACIEKMKDLQDHTSKTIVEGLQGLLLK